MRFPPRGEGQARLGVSIAVPERWADELQDARRRFGDPQADAIPPHITVVGPTVVDEGRLDEVAGVLADAAASVEPFRVVLRGAGSFRPVSPVVFVQVAMGIAGCERLEAAARRGPLGNRPRFYYHPHVTVAHEVPDDALDRAFEEMAGFEAGFDVTELHLFEHGDDGVWRPVRAFPLGARVREASA